MNKLRKMLCSTYMQIKASPTLKNKIVLEIASDAVNLTKTYMNSGITKEKSENMAIEAIIPSEEEATKISLVYYGSISKGITQLSGKTAFILLTLLFSTISLLIVSLVNSEGIFQAIGSNAYYFFSILALSSVVFFYSMNSKLFTYHISNDNNFYKIARTIINISPYILAILPFLLSFINLMMLPEYSLKNQIEWLITTSAQLSVGFILSMVTILYWLVIKIKENDSETCKNTFEIELNTLLKELDNV